MRTICLGTRGSDLALAQSREVASLLETTNSDCRVELKILRTRGDDRLDLSLKSTGPLTKGLFTQELEEALRSGEIDLAVHSLKDLPGERAEGLALGAVLPREDPADVFLSMFTQEAFPSGGVVGTSSPRRGMQIAQTFPGCKIEEIRGNVPTRIRKLLGGKGYDGILLALAGLKRLGFVNAEDAWTAEAGEFSKLHLWRVEKMLPAPGQGAVAVEIRKGDEEMQSLLSSLHCERTWTCVETERLLLRELGGGCHLALGARAEFVNEKEIHLRAAFYPENREACFASIHFLVEERNAAIQRLIQDWNL